MGRDPFFMCTECLPVYTYVCTCAWCPEARRGCRAPPTLESDGYEPPWRCWTTGSPGKAPVLLTIEPTPRGEERDLKGVQGTEVYVTSIQKQGLFGGEEGDQSEEHRQGGLGRAVSRGTK